MTYHQPRKNKVKSKSISETKSKTLLLSVVDGTSTVEASEKKSEKFPKVKHNWIRSHNDFSKPCQQGQISAEGKYTSDHTELAYSFRSKRHDHHDCSKVSIVSDIPLNNLNEDTSVDTDNTSLNSGQTPIITNKTKKVWKTTKNSTSWNEFIIDNGGCNFFNYDKKCLAGDDDDFYQAKSTFSADFEEFENFDEEASDLFTVEDIPKTEVDILETCDPDENEEFETNSDIFAGIDSEDPVSSATPHMFCDNFFLQQESSAQTDETKKRKKENQNTSVRSDTVIQRKPTGDCKTSQIERGYDSFDGLDSHDEFVSFTSNTFREEKYSQNFSTSQSLLDSKESITFQNTKTQSNPISPPNENIMLSEKVTDSKSLKKSKNEITENIESICSNEQLSTLEEKNARNSDIDHSLFIRVGWVQSIVRIIQTKTEQFNKRINLDAETSSYSQIHKGNNMIENDGDESPRCIARFNDSQGIETKSTDQYFFGTVQTVRCNDEYICKNTMINLSSKIRDSRAQKLRLFYSYQNGKEVMDTENIARAYNFANNRLQEKYFTSMSDTEIDVKAVSQFLKLSMDAHERALLHLENENFPAAIRVYEVHIETSRHGNFIKINKEKILINSYILHNIGIIYMQTGAYDVSVRKFIESLSLRQELDDGNMIHPDIAKTLNAMGISYFAANCLDDALQVFEDALHILRMVNTEHYDIPDTLGNLAVTHFILGNYKLSMKQLEDVLDMQRRLLIGQLLSNSMNSQIINMAQNMIGDVVEVLCELSFLSYFSGKFYEARTFLNEAISTHQIILGEDETFKKLKSFQEILVSQLKNDQMNKLG